jgi:hypothetical protein
MTAEEVAVELATRHSVFVASSVLSTQVSICVSDERCGTDGREETDRRVSSNSLTQGVVPSSETHCRGQPR